MLIYCNKYHKMNCNCELCQANDKIKQLEDEITEWMLKYIDVCEKKDLLMEGKDE